MTVTDQTVVVNVEPRDMTPERFAGVLSALVMQRRMGLSAHHLQVVGLIVCAVAVTMMDNLATFKIAANCLFGDQPMLKDVPVRVRRWMTWRELENVAIGVRLQAALPRRMQLTVMRARVARMRAVSTVALCSHCWPRIYRLSAPCAWARNATRLVLAGPRTVLASTLIDLCLLPGEWCAANEAGTLNEHRTHLRCHAGGVHSAARFPYVDANSTMLGGLTW